MFYIPVSKRDSLGAITHSPPQKPKHKDLGRNGPRPAITPKAAYASVSNRGGSRFSYYETVSSLLRNSLASFFLKTYNECVNKNVGWHHVRKIKSYVGESHFSIYFLDHYVFSYLVSLDLSLRLQRD